VGGEEEPLKKYAVELTPAERTDLEALARKGEASARRMKRALVLLAADDGATDEEIAAKVRVRRTTVEHIRQRFVEEGQDAALSEGPRPAKARPPGKARLVDGCDEAHLESAHLRRLPAFVGAVALGCVLVGAWLWVYGRDDIVTGLVLLLGLAGLALIPCFAFAMWVASDWVDELGNSKKRSVRQISASRLTEVLGWFTLTSMRGWLVSSLVLGGLLALGFVYGTVIYEPKEGDPCPPPFGARQETVREDGRIRTFYIDDDGNRFECAAR
jgi:hypothetical protein